jgi:hypothetical protein
VPAIVGYVPKEMVHCLSAFLDACYIARRQDIDTTALNSFEAAVDQFMELHEVFHTSGVRLEGFRLPRQHSLIHYHHQVENFSLPGGVCSSITESRHKSAVRIPWRRSNHFEALGQMLLINQCLDKLAAMHSDFAERGMLPAGHTPPRNTMLPNTPTRPRPRGDDSDGKDEGPVKGDVVMGHVVLARMCGMSPIVELGNCV